MEEYNWPKCLSTHCISSFGDGSEKMVQFLRSSIGIIHKKHAESITSYIKESVDEELEEETVQDGEGKMQKKRLTVLCGR